MIIYVKTLGGKTITLDVEQTNTVLDLKRMVLDKEGIPLQHQGFVFQGKLMENSSQLSEYSGLTNQTSLHLMLSMGHNFRCQLPDGSVVKAGGYEMDILKDALRRHGWVVTSFAYEGNVLEGTDEEVMTQLIDIPFPDDGEWPFVVVDGEPAPSEEVKETPGNGEAGEGGNDEEVHSEVTVEQ